MNNFPSRKTVERIKEQYPKGIRIELIEMNDPYSKLKAGDTGTVAMVDDIGTVFVEWDNGSGLGLVFGEDKYRKLQKED